MSMEYRALGDFCTVTSSKRIFAEQYVDSGIPFYRSKEIIEKNSGAEISEPLYISPEVYENIKDKFGVPQKGDVLLTSVGTIGIPYVVKEEEFYFKDGNLTWMKDFSEGLSPQYLYYWLSSKFGRDSLMNRCIGSSQAALTIDILKKYKLLIPSRHVQNEIVSILSAYDNLIEVNNKRIKVLEQMAENLYKEWFVRFRFPGHESVPFDNGLPQGWEKKRINELCTFLNGFAFKSEEYDEIGEFIVVTIKNVQNGQFDLSSIERIDAIPKRMPEYCRLKTGDVLMSLTGNVARVCIVSENNCLLNQRVCRIESDYPHYTYLFFKQEEIYSTLCNLAYGTAQLNLSPILAGKLKVALPPVPLRKQFNDSVSSLFEQRQVLIEENNNLVKQRDLLLPRLMSGKLEV